MCLAYVLGKTLFESLSRDQLINLFKCIFTFSFKLNVLG